jgi:hypothetical protein
MTVESTLYIKIREELIKNHLKTPNFENDHASIVQLLKNTKVNSRLKLLPEMMDIFSKGFERKLN